MKSNKFSKIKKVGNHLTSIFKNHPEWPLLSLFFLLAIYALIIFNSYATKSPPATEMNNQLQINSELYRQTLEQLRSRDSNIKQGIEQNYPNVFR